METQNNNPQQKSFWNLFSGIAFAGIGAYGVYKHFYIVDDNNSSFRLIIAVILFGYGAYKLYNYFRA
ncbi:hypothetical protein [Lacinutrix chionoecetis]